MMDVLPSNDENYQTLCLPLVEDPAKLWRGWGRIKVGVEHSISPSPSPSPTKGEGVNWAIF